MLFRSFEFLLRKTVLRKLNREDQDIALVLKDEIQLSVLCFLALITVLLMPCVLLLVICFLVEETLVNSGCIIFTFLHTMDLLHGLFISLYLKFQFLCV